MAEHAPAGTTPQALPAFDDPTLSLRRPRSPHSQSHSTPNPARRHSLPLHFLPPSLWSANTSTASLVVESEEAARGEHILDEATVAHRISALRQLNGATNSRHRYAKSTGARNSTFSQPVIVRTYSGAARPRSQQRDLVTVKKENGLSAMATAKMDLKLPPVEAFSFKGIMDEIRHGVAEDLERIAEICARSKYSLSNQYEVHMPPHGRGEPFLQTPAQASGSNANAAGPTLQAIAAEDEHARHVGRGSRGGRRTKSIAYGTLETIMSSSRSSDEDKSKKKPAAIIAEEVRGRAAAKKELEMETAKKDAAESAIEPGPSQQRPKHLRSRSATFASVIIDNAQGSKDETLSQLVSPTSLISEPARPQTSTADLGSIQTFGQSDHPRSPTLQSLMSLKPSMIQNESRASNLRSESAARPSILGSLSSWLPWSKPQSEASHGRLQGPTALVNGWQLKCLVRIGSSNFESAEKCERYSTSPYLFKLSITMFVPARREEDEAVSGPVDVFTWLFKTTEYSDLTNRSPFFANIVMAMSHAAMYHCTLVYILADKYQIEALKDAAIEKFAKATQDEWNVDTPSTLTASLEVIYSGTCEEEHRGLKDVAIRAAWRNIDKLLDDFKFKMVCQQIGEIGFDLLRLRASIEELGPLLSLPKCTHCGQDTDVAQTRTNFFIACDLDFPNSGI
ncbi:hypothetical protein G7Y89_g4846 [Cudoniella acicularis]|uniref:BTB domain-containing protein n=1 Tax=Cudoniella acicularis TaxID=354080 RepID=A0A8H4RPY3_9HELO|nr:hypothetical protein G7Y89_g4846 [Cudoniella acicularis]